MFGALDGIVWLLVWAAVGVFNLWIWQKGKNNANMLMMCGAWGIALLGVAMLTESRSILDLARWTSLFGTVAFGAGFYLSVQVQIQAQVNALKEKASGIAGGSDDGDKSDKSDEAKGDEGGAES